MKKLFVFLPILLAILLVSPGKAQGPDATPIPTPSDDDVNRIAKNMYCPVCENVPLDTCETKACKDWREEIRLKLSEGWTDQQIYDYFVEQHGDRVLAAPPARGLNWLVYIVPPAAVLVGIFFVFRLLRSSMPSSPTPDAEKTSEDTSPPAADQELVSKLEQELKDRD